MIKSDCLGNTKRTVVYIFNKIVSKCPNENVPKNGVKISKSPNRNPKPCKTLHTPQLDVTIREGFK